MSLMHSLDNDDDDADNAGDDDNDSFDPKHEKQFLHLQLMNNGFKSIFVLHSMIYLTNMPLFKHF